MSRAERAERAERGSVSIEVVALVPLLVLVALLVLQLGAAGWTASQTSEAARVAARAQSLGQDPLAAAERVLPDAMEVVEVRSDGGAVEIEVRVPRVSPLPEFTVTRDVAMPERP